MKYFDDFQKIERKFYLRNTIDVAQDLLGNLIVRKIKDKFIAGKIVEVEVYLPEDPASHSYNGKTERNSAMFMEGGHLYVYFTYGMHYCANIVTENENYGSAILLRAIEPVIGLDIIKKLRGNIKNEYNLTNGPAKLCSALNITRKLNKEDLTGDTIFCSYNLNNKEKFYIEKSPRIGIKKAKDKLLRFYIKDNPYVSKSN
ncbi:MAG TPA: DNA-3-methyladenine glycosylase [Ignavibacteria bacterium]